MWHPEMDLIRADVHVAGCSRASRHLGPRESRPDERHPCKKQKASVKAVNEFQKNIQRADTQRLRTIFVDLILVASYGQG